MTEQHTHALRSLRAAGIRVDSYSLSSVRFTYAGTSHDVRFTDVADWLLKQSLAPTSTAIQIEALREDVQRLAHRVSRLEDEATALRAVVPEERLYLCYVDRYGDNDNDKGTLRLWFTSDMDRTYGDDWNDAPYEHNAGPPYDYHRSQRPDEKGGWVTVWPDRPYLVQEYTLTIPESVSVAEAFERGFRGTAEEINRDRLPWLYVYLHSTGWDNEIAIKAGVSLQAVRELVEQLGCKLAGPVGRDS